MPNEESDMSWTFLHSSMQGLKQGTREMDHCKLLQPLKHWKHLPSRIVSTIRHGLVKAEHLHQI